MRQKGPRILLALWLSALPTPILAEEVTVEGRVLTTSESDLSGLSLVFRSDHDSVSAPLFSNGDFSTELPHAGRYGLALKAHPYLAGFTFEWTAKAGANKLDLPIPAGEASITVDAGDRTLTGAVEVRLLDGLGRAGVWGFVAAEQASGPIRIAGLPEGDYRATVATDQLGAIAAVPFTLTAARPRTGVVVELAPRSYELMLIDAGGGPVEGATVHVGPMVFDALESGRFELSGASAGLPFIVRPPAGLAPTCGVIGEEEAMTARLQPAAHEIRFTLPDVQPIIGFIRSTNGPECYLPMHLYRDSQSVQSGERILTLHGLAAGDYEAIFVRPDVPRERFSLVAPASRPLSR